MGGGGAFIDYDRDGLLDVLLINSDWWLPNRLPGSRPTMKLYRNLGNGKFDDVSKQTGLDVPIQGMGAAVGDFDNDGFDDLVVTGVHDLRLFKNEDGKRFSNVTAKSGIVNHGWSTSAAWLDYDRDGKLDLFVCNYVKWTIATDVFCGVKIKTYCEPSVFQADSCRLYRNLGSGKFADETNASGLQTNKSKALGVCILDFDQDGWPDIFVANDLMPNALYRNTGKGKFTDIGLETGMAVSESGISRAGMGVDSADMGATGRHAISIGNFTNEGLALYDTSGPPPYIDASTKAGTNLASAPYVTFGLVFSDLDNDSQSDLVITNGHIADTVSITHRGQTYEQPAQVFRNMGDLTFADVSAQAGAGITTPLVGRGLARGDFDNDGRMDLLLIPNFGPCRLLRNESDSKNSWITLKLTGTKSNRNGYGAFVVITAEGKKQTGLCRSGSGYLTASDQRLHFGLGTATGVESVQISWPSGLKETWKDLQPGRQHDLVEGSGTKS